MIIVGASGSGKTSLLHALTSGKFLDNQMHTIGVEFAAKVLPVGSGDAIKIQIWDTAGQERFRSITRSYYRGAAAALLVFDTSRRASFSQITSWLSDCRNLTGPHTVIVLVGSKVDLTEQREVSFEEASRFAQENNLSYVETSAKTGQNVQEAFVRAANKVYENIQKGLVAADNVESGVQLAKAYDVGSSEKGGGKGGSCAC